MELGTEALEGGREPPWKWRVLVKSRRVVVWSNERSSVGVFVVSSGVFLERRVVDPCW